MLRGRVRIALALILALGVTGCESLDKFNPFGDGKKPLPGTRTPVFPGGVPGVESRAPLLQPSNSNVSLGAAPTVQPD
ncbi:hypothetical protein GCM10007301_53590 [Azorhizobium oxalatiphilum]|uniref:Lipoprotein n=1 Tax=Azorhizobium oxalatiphilum TaxID=980631 RepID=A0A917CGA3_9HYPH|nr:hypothetical protein [Azorhizobium oxalatiphilum]GGF86986.1 hypothetical protein GCM10007301_53590 [Azorhizobium oxalatiphilum]